MFPVTDIMTKNVVTVSKETLALQAARIMVDKHITGIPVVDQDNQLVGIISEFDILKLLVDSQREKELKVEDLMTKKVLSFDDTATAVEVCEFFLNNPSKRRVPITHNGKLAGLVSRADIVKLIVKLRNV